MISVANVELEFSLSKTFRVQMSVNIASKIKMNASHWVIFCCYIDPPYIASPYIDEQTEKSIISFHQIRIIDIWNTKIEYQYNS